MKSKKIHPLTGNQNAAKPDSEKVSEERLTISLPKGTRTRIVRVANGGKITPWIREAIEEKLERG